MHAQLIAAGSAAVAVLALWRFFIRLRRDRVVADTPAARIRSAAQGYVKVNGRALPAGAVPSSAPLSGRPCVWWDFVIARNETDARGNRHWRETERATSVELFVLEDDDGARCLVGPVTAEITPTDSNVWYGALPRPTGPLPESHPLLDSGEWRYTERLLGVGARLCVMGELRSHSEVGDVSAAAAQKLREWKQDQPRLLARFDTNHDGRLDAAEWEAARLAAASEAQAQTLGSGVERISVISEPANDEPFLIAPLSTVQLGNRERVYAAVYFLVGLISVCVCAWELGHGL
ncbi:MAG: GIDE domain-containing protein [Steroidobacteraceae bacterium]